PDHGTELNPTSWIKNRTGSAPSTKDTGMYIDQVLVQGERVVHRGHLLIFTLMPEILLGVLLLPLGPIFWVRAWLRYRSTELAVTNRRVIAKFGLIQRRTTEMNLD